jgi:hypothetical protein
LAPRSKIGGCPKSNFLDSPCQHRKGFVVV